MSQVPEMTFLPPRFQIERELREQLSNRPGHQRCLEGAAELLLVLHEVPQPGVPERDALLFWKQQNRQWVDASGRQGLAGVQELLDRYERAIDIHEESIEVADTAVEIFAILRHAGPLARTSRNLALALQQCLELEPDDRVMRSLSDRAREIERAAELLHADSRVSLEFWQAKRTEEQARMSCRLSKIAFRLYLLSAIFLPLVAFGGLMGMNVDQPEWVKRGFWAIFICGLGAGALVLWAINRRIAKYAERNQGE
jgi:Mg2+ and Co2+ transporter CorA